MRSDAKIVNLNAREDGHTLMNGEVMRKNWLGGEGVKYEWEVQTG